MKQARNEVHDAEASVLFALDVWKVSVLREHIIASALLHEEETVELIAFVSYELPRGRDTSFEERANPGDELLILVLEEVYFFVDRLVDVYR